MSLMLQPDTIVFWEGSLLLQQLAFLPLIIKPYFLWGEMEEWEEPEEIRKW